MKTLISSIPFVLILSAASTGRADVIANLPEHADQALTLRAGLDSAVAVAAGYAHRVRPAFWQHDVLLYGELAFPAGGLDLGDWAVEAGVRTTALARGDLRLQIVAGPVLRNTNTDLFAANSVGLHAALLPGYQSERWGLMAELGYEKQLATHLRHAEIYRTEFFPDAKSGWYSSSAGTVRMGVRGGVRVGTVQLSMRAGMQMSEGGEAHVPPFYATLGTSYAF